MGDEYVAVGEAVMVASNVDHLKRDSIHNVNVYKGRLYPGTRAPTARGERWVLLYSPRKQYVDQQGWDLYFRIQSHAPSRKDRPILPPLDRGDPARRTAWVPFLPSDPGVLMWDGLVSLVDATYSAFFIPLSLAFHSQLVVLPAYAYTNWTAASIFGLDMVLGFLTGFAVVHDRTSIMMTSFREASRFFMLHNNFFPDLLVVSSVVLEQILLGKGDSPSSWAIRYVVLMRCSRLIRVFWLIQLLMYNTFIGNFMSTWTDVDFLFLGIVFYSTLVFLHLMAVFWYFIAAIEGVEHSWIATKTLNGTPLVSLPYWQQYVSSLHFVTVTVTTIGYGDVSPNTALEQVVSIFMMLVGVVFFGIVITSSQELIRRLSKSARTAEALRSKMKAVEDWARHRKMKSEVYGDICLYYANTWLPHCEESADDKIFNELPADLRTRVAASFTKDLIERSRVFSCLSTLQKGRLASYLRPVTVAAGHDLCRTGDEITGLWVLQEGSLEMRRHDRLLKLVNSPAIVGEAGVAGVLMMQHSDTMSTPHHHLTKALRRRATTLRAICYCRLWHINILHLDLIAGMEPGSHGKIVESFREFFKEKMHHFPEEIDGIWEGSDEDGLGSKTDPDALDELAEADTEELETMRAPHQLNPRRSLLDSIKTALAGASPQQLPYISRSGPNEHL